MSFGRTLDKGIARLKKAAAAAKSQNQKHIDSKDAFEMWDTYGFPVDLTQVRSRTTTPCLALQCSYNIHNHSAVATHRFASSVVLG